MYARGARAARKLTPLVLEAYRRWQNLSPEERERYKKMVRDATERGRTAVDQARRRRLERQKKKPKRRH